MNDERRENRGSIYLSFTPSKANSDDDLKWMGNEVVSFRLVHEDVPQLLRGVPWNGRAEFMPDVGRMTSNPQDRHVMLGLRLVGGRGKP
jgi:hypothetical protein